MDKKLTLVCIGAVIILIIGTFTPVVGFQQAQSTTCPRASPLFSIRTRRAVDDYEDSITSDYLGEGDIVNIPLPYIDRRLTKISQIVTQISMMDDIEFVRFIPPGDLPHMIEEKTT